MNLVFRAFGIFNILLAVFFASQIVWTRVQESADTGSFVFWTILSVGSLVAGSGYFLRTRWVALVGVVPVVLLSLFIAFASLAGGWIWGPRQSSIMDLLVVGGFALALLQLIGLLLLFVGTRRRPPDTPSETHTPS